MTVKESIKSLMESLENEGLNRLAVGKELGYSEKSIAPLLSRGGNERFMRILDLLLQKAKLEKKVREYERVGPVKDLTSKMKKHLDALTEQIDAMKEIVVSSDENKKAPPHASAEQDLSKHYVPVVPLPDDISEAQGRQNGRGKNRVKGKFDKVRKKKN